MLQHELSYLYLCICSNGHSCFIILVKRYIDKHYILSAGGGSKCIRDIRVVDFNANFYNISGISWLSVLLVEETGVLGENHRPVASHGPTLSHYVVSSTPRHEQGSDSQL